MADLSTVFAGLQLKNPIIIGSSGLSDSTENIIRLEEKGAAAIVLKSLFEEEILMEMNANLNRMNAEGFLYPETVDYYDFYEGPEENTIRYIRQIENARRSLSIPVIGSINCLTADRKSRSGCP
jgi:dihydroorotate dehydrogenase (fumarate)